MQSSLHRCSSPAARSAPSTSCPPSPRLPLTRRPDPTHSKRTPTLATPLAKAKPTDAIPRGAWWTIFNDPELNKLEPQVETANQTLAQADANLIAARAEIRVRNADRFPTVGTTTSISGVRYSDNKPYFNPVGANSGYR